MHYYRGQTSQLKSSSKQSKVKNYFSKADPAKSTSIFDKFNRQLLAHENPLPLVENPNTRQSELTI